MSVPRDLILYALDALEIGDQAEAVELLLDALDSPIGGAPPVCGVCNVKAWPGDDQAHIFSLHHAEQNRQRVADLERAA